MGVTDGYMKQRYPRQYRSAETLAINHRYIDHNFPT